MEVLLRMEILVVVAEVLRRTDSRLLEVAAVEVLNTEIREAVMAGVLNTETLVVAAEVLLRTDRRCGDLHRDLIHRLDTQAIHLHQDLVHRLDTQIKLFVL